MYGAPRTYNRTRPNPFALGEHICGTEADFARGAVYDPAVNRPAGPSGWPVCCGIDRADLGALQLGGVASVGYTPPPYRPGGVLLSGVAVVGYLPSGGSRGGVELSGEATVTYIAPPDAHGGAELSGVAVVAYLPPGGSSGGALLAGEASVTYAPPHSSSGGAELSGVAGVWYLPPGGSSGGVELSGVAVVAYIPPAPGGVELSGEATVAYIPPAVGPGPTCDTAEVIDLGEMGSAVKGAAEEWWRCEATATGFYTVAVSGIDPTFDVELWAGFECAEKYIQATASGGLFWYGILFEGWSAFIRIVGGEGDPYTVQVDPA